MPELQTARTTSLHPRGDFPLPAVEGLGRRSATHDLACAKSGTAPCRCVPHSARGVNAAKIQQIQSLMRSFTASQIAEQVRGEVLGDGSTLLTGFASADKPGPATSPLPTQDHFAAAEQSAAAAILVSGDFSSTKKVLIRVPNARVAVARLLPVFFPPDQSRKAFIPARTLIRRRRLIPRRISGPTA